MSKFEIPTDEIKALQNVSLNMCLFFDEFCKKHGLTYFLCGGCCIGAVRTGGFIPWDDDVDVFMPRKDYERFISLWEDTEKYEIQYTTKDFNFCCPFVNICDKTTTFIKTYRKDLDISHGVALDILPLDGCPTGFKRKMQKLYALAFSLFNVGKAPDNHGGLVNLIGKIALKLISSEKLRYKIWKFCEKQMTKYPIEKCDYITELCSGPHYMQNEYPKEAFAEEKRVLFENYLLPIPADYDAYLTMAFGDYMSLPPEEKRVCHHEHEFLDLENGYLKYKGIYYLN